MQDKDNKKKYILLVEDDYFIASLLVKKLQKECLPFEHAKTGEEGLEKARLSKPGIVLLDLVLPGIDGYEVLTQLKMDPNLSSVPVVILSNLGQKNEIEQCLRLGAVDFLVKAHFDMDQIVQRIKKIMKG